MTPDARSPAQPSSGGLRGSLPRARGPRLPQAIRGALLRAAETLDSALDGIPTYDDGKWYRYGHWGCRLGVFRRAWNLWGGDPKPGYPGPSGTLQPSGPDELAELLEEFDQDPDFVAAREVVEALDHLIDGLVALRKAAGLSPSDVAERIGVPLAVIEDFESEVSDPSMSLVYRYTRAVGARLVTSVVTPEDQ